MRGVAGLLIRAGAVLFALFLIAAVTGQSAGSAQAEIDLTGTWEVFLTGDRSDACTSEYEQDGAVLHTYATCVAYGSGPFDGSMDLSSEGFTLSGTLTNELGTTYDVEIVGTASPDGAAIGGSWSVPAEEISGTFVGVRQMELETSPPSPSSLPSPAPASPDSMSEPLEVAADVTLPDTGRGSDDSGSGAPPAALLGAGTLLMAAGTVVFRLRRRRHG